MGLNGHIVSNNQKLVSKTNELNPAEIARKGLCLGGEAGVQCSAALRALCCIERLSSNHVNDSALRKNLDDYNGLLKEVTLAAVQYKDKLLPVSIIVVQCVHKHP